MKNTKFLSRKIFFRVAALAAFALPFSVALAPSARAEAVWVPGVSSAGGYIDINKSGDIYSGPDSMMCWAATASNIIAWWQSQAPASAIPAGVPRTQAEIYTAFTDSFKNVGRGTDIAWEWYFGGCDLVASNYENDFKVANPKTDSGRYWQNYVDETVGWTNEGMPEWIAWGNLKDLSDDQRYAKAAAGVLAGMLATGPVALSISYGSDSNYASGHAITLWGIEYEGDVLKTIYVTDSDDDKANADVITCAVTSVEKSIAASSDGKTPAWTEYSYTIYLGGTATLSTWSALALPVPVPEPSAFGLLAGLGALALAATRRRRKKA